MIQLLQLAATFGRVLSSHRQIGTVSSRASNEGYARVYEDFKAPGPWMPGPVYICLA